MQKTKTTTAPKRRPRHEPAAPDQRLLFKSQVTTMLGVGYTTLWQWMCDGQFPRPIELGPPGGRSSTIAWHAHEIHDWIKSRPRRMLGVHEFRGRDTSQQQQRKRAIQRI